MTPILLFLRVFFYFYNYILIVRRVLVLSLFIFFTYSSNAQFYLFAGIGGDYYQGDVTESSLPSLNTLKLSYGAGLGYHFNDRWGARLQYLRGTMHGSDSYSGDVLKQARGVTFTTPFWDIGLHFTYNHLFRRSYKLINYGFFGLDYTNMTVSRSVTGTAALIAERSFSKSQFNLPIGIGFGRWIGRHWGVVLEVSYHYGFTDYFDGTALSGNSKAMDSFVVTHLMLIYRIKPGGNPGGVFDPSRLNNVDCPKFGY